jgi:hypothetical protein
MAEWSCEQISQPFLTFGGLQQDGEEGRPLKSPGSEGNLYVLLVAVDKFH